MLEFYLIQENIAQLEFYKSGKLQEVLEFLQIPVLWEMDPHSNDPKAPNRMTSATVRAARSSEYLKWIL